MTPPSVHPSRLVLLVSFSRLLQLLRLLVLQQLSKDTQIRDLPSLCTDAHCPKVLWVPPSNERLKTIKIPLAFSPTTLFQSARKKKSPKGAQAREHNARSIGRIATEGKWPKVRNRHKETLMVYPKSGQPWYDLRWDRLVDQARRTFPLIFTPQ